MSFRPRRVTHSRRARLASLVEGEERQQLVVTILFILTIAAVVLILLGAVGLAWYNDNLRPLANVSGVDIGPPQLRAYVSFEGWRIQRDSDRITQATMNSTIDATAAQTLQTALNTETQDLANNAVNQLVDLVYQSQLAATQGITVSDQDVDQRLLADVSSAEQRHVLAIFVAPQAADPTAGPTAQEQKDALANAQAALAALNSGQSFADVAKQYSTDTSAQNGGDYGMVTKGMVTVDTDWGNALFKLPQGGTTDIILGSDGVYRIGRVTEIVPGTEEPGRRDGLFQVVPEQDVRQILRYQIASERLQDKIVSDALAQTPEQARIAVIYIDGLDTGDTTEADGEIHYSEIVFAPNHDETNASTLAADDPAWGTALQDANNALAQIQAETDPTTRETTFQRLASELSDDPTKSQNGDVGWMTKGLTPTALSDTLWGSAHQKDDVLGPIRSDNGYYLLLYQGKRASFQDRIKAVQDALAQPGADFNAVAKQLDEGPEKDAGGEIGWVLRSDLATTIGDTIFTMAVGQISDPVELGNGHYIIKLEEKKARALDPDQTPAVRANAFSDWYSNQLATAQTNGTVTIAGQTPVPTLQPGSDQVLPSPSL